MNTYLQLVDTVLNNGIKRENRTGIDTIMYFGYHYKVDLAKGFPLLTTKKYFLIPLLESYYGILREKLISEIYVSILKFGMHGPMKKKIGK